MEKKIYFYCIFIAVCFVACQNNKECSIKKDCISRSDSSADEIKNCCCNNVIENINSIETLSKGQIYSKSFPNIGVIEIFENLGTFCIDENPYRVFKFLKKVNIANGIKQQHKLIIINKKKIIAYYSDSANELPDSISCCKFYFGKKIKIITEDDLKNELIYTGIYKESELYSNILFELGYDGVEAIVKK
jgi:hypothetical protein